MDVQLLAPILVLASAAMHACWNALVKSKGSAFQTLACIQIAAGLISVPFIFILPAMHPDAWPYLLVSVVVHQVYFLVLARSYFYGDLSQVYPLVRGSSPLFVAFFATVFIGEYLGPQIVCGVALVSLSIMSLALFSKNKTEAHGKTILLSLLTGVLIAIFTTIDGTGARISGEPVTYSIWLFTLDATPLLLFAGLKNRLEFKKYILEHSGTTLAGGFLVVLSYALVVWAMSVHQMAYISALRETSVILGAVIGTALLKEPFGRVRIASSCLVALGVILMSLP